MKAFIVICSLLLIAIIVYVIHVIVHDVIYYKLHLHGCKKCKKREKIEPGESYSEEELYVGGSDNSDDEEG